MKRKKYLTLAVTSLLLLSAAVVSANVPAPPVNQLIGMPDDVFNNMKEPVCRACHQDSGTTEIGMLADRHHFLVGAALRQPSDSIFCSPGGTYECLSCHTLVTNPVTTTVTFTSLRDCFTCHKQLQSQATVHHRTPASQARDCQACHWNINNPDDGHFIPDTPGSTTTPMPGNGQNGSGGCLYCHNSGTDRTTGNPIYTNAQTHHSTGVSLGPYMPTQNSCLICHAGWGANGNPLIRACETCHGIKLLHAIQADSNGDGQIAEGTESPGYGHIGATQDCQGCHGQAIPAGPRPPEIIPDAPRLFSLSTSKILQGTAAIITMQGADVTSLVENADGSITKLISNAILTSPAGKEIVLSPAQVSESQLTVSVPPYTPAGSYIVRLLKGQQRSNSKNILIVPGVTINEIVCTPQTTTSTLTISGSGFGNYYVGMGSNDSGIGVATDLGPCTISAWTATEITAACNSNCGTNVIVDALLGNASAPIGSALRICTSCHLDKSALVDCKNIKWRLHQRNGSVTQAIYALAETTYLEAVCAATTPVIVKDRTRKIK